MPAVMNIMDTKQRIKDLSTFLLLNSCALPSSGLAQGKAGVALALFEAAHFLKDNYLEDKAFGLIEEALLTKTENISLSSGTSGIGLVLKHLIGRRLLEADFSDLFEDRLQHISQRTEELIGRKLYKLPDMMGLYVFWHYMDTDQAVAERQCCLDIIDRYLSNHFSDLEKGGKLPIDLTPTVALLASYLQMLCRCHGEGISIPLLCRFKQLYASGRLCGSQTLKFYWIYLSKTYPGVLIPEELSMTDYGNTEGLDVMPLSELQSIHYLRLKDTATFIPERERVIANYVACTDEELEQRLSRIAYLHSAGVGLGSGITKLLLLLCYALNDDLDDDARDMFDPFLL